MQVVIWVSRGCCREVVASTSGDGGSSCERQQSEGLQSGCSGALQPHRLNITCVTMTLIHWTGKLNTDCLCGARYKICRAGLPHRTGSGLARGLSETVLLVNTLLREQNDFNHLRTAVLGNDKVVTENYISQNKVTNIREHADAEHRMFPKALHFIFQYTTTLTFQNVSLSIYTKCWWSYLLTSFKASLLNRTHMFSHSNTSALTQLEGHQKQHDQNRAEGLNWTGLHC